MGNESDPDNNYDLIKPDENPINSVNSEMNNACNDISPKSLTIEPTFIDFGHLKPHVSPKTRLKLDGGPATIRSTNDRITVMPAEIITESGIIEVSVSGGEEGDLLWDSIEILGANENIEVPLCCNWDEGLADVKTSLESEVVNDVEIPRITQEIPIKVMGDVEKSNVEQVPEIAVSIMSSSEERDFIAHVCPICKRNLIYDSNTASWLQCAKCKSNVVGSLASLAAEEGSKGIQDLKKTAKDFWEVLTGKKTLNIR